LINPRAGTTGYYMNGMFRIMTPSPHSHRISTFPNFDTRSLSIMGGTNDTLDNTGYLVNFWIVLLARFLASVCPRSKSVDVFTRRQ